MTSADFAAILRNLADEIELLAPQMQNCRPSVELRVHAVDDKATLLSLLPLLLDPKPRNSDGTHWITEERDNLQITIYYEPGLLGSTYLTEKTVLPKRETLEHDRPLDLARELVSE